ncbi:MFS transporter [Bosea sp. (in: a-proteobacteria)]|uniref:MFS transporter n=1 Tax=Bosea sp. (in: a-proteobacteria) TaxID=1871050 RepID=UPI00273606C2|nr:MFS transporter [Bosea sp. (in: a-proteobacteria)]MDP3407762.1 MFS transporter [Bosea sp. (in: a-proteobacteria)]
MPAILPVFSRLPPHGLLICGLVVTRIIGWGTTFYALSVLARDIQRDLSLDVTLVYGGITLLLLTGAALGPAIGKRLDVEGTRGAMCIGAVACAVGLGLLALAQGPVSYLAAWVVIGIGHAFSLANVGSVTVAQLMGERTRRVIGLMMLATGLSSTVFWPLTAVLAEAYGWRATWVVFAALQIVIVLPIYAMIPRLAPVAGPSATPAASSDSAADGGRVAVAQRRGAFWLVALVFSASGLVSWGLPLHLIDLMRQAGIGATEAVGIAALSGPATLLARLVDATVGDRFPVEQTALAGLLLGPLSLMLLVWAPGVPLAAAAFVICFSAAMGVISVARATLPLALFGRGGIGALLGRLTVPQNIAFAASPLLFAAMIAHVGRDWALIASAAIQIVAVVAMLALLRLLARG